MVKIKNIGAEEYNLWVGTVLYAFKAGEEKDCPPEVSDAVNNSVTARQFLKEKTTDIETLKTDIDDIKLTLAKIKSRLGI